MWSFGAIDSHDNDVNYANVGAMNALANMSIAAWVELNLFHGATNQGIFGQHASSVGWMMAVTAAETLRFLMDGATSTEATALTVDSTPHSVVMVLDSGGGGDIWLDAVDDGNVSTGAPTTNTEKMTVGDAGNAANGSPAKIGHCMAWNVAIPDSDVVDYDVGVAVPPSLSDLKFWTKCVGTTPTNAEIPIGGVGTQVNTVTEHIDAVDAYYGGGVSSIRWLIAQHWGTLLAASAAFGSALKMEEREPLLVEVREVMGCHFYGTDQDHSDLIEFAGRSPVAYG